MRYRAVEHLGWREVPAVLDDIPESLAKARSLKDNNQWGEVVEQDLAELLVGLQVDSVDLRTLGFPDDELTRLLDSVGALSTSLEEAPEPDLDHAAELQAKWQTAVGQLWSAGEHRLLIGDSTHAEHVARLMDGERAALVATSPPYGEQRDYTTGPMDWSALVCPALTLPLAHLASDGSVLVNLGLVHRDGRVVEYWRPLFDAMESAGWPLFGWYVWDKLEGMAGDWNGRLAPAHEWVFHFAGHPRRATKTKQSKHAGEAHGPLGMRNADGSVKGWAHQGRPIQDYKIPDSVIRAYAAKGGIEGHPAPFSVAFAVELIEPYSARGEIVHEPFAGSGSMILACEQLGRQCRAMELSPAYAAIALQRLADLGLAPRRVEAGA